MFATQKQLRYLQDLAWKVDYTKRRHPSLVPLGVYYEKYEFGISSQRASMLISMYRDILDKAYAVIYKNKGQSNKKAV